MEGDCYYAILNVDRTATEEEIKRAYRKLAVRYHPDKNLDNKEFAEKKFKEIGEAYSVLSDESKRRHYDRFGKSGMNGAGAGGGGGGMGNFREQDAEEIFRQFFGGQDPFSMFFQESMGGGAARGGPFGGGGTRVHVSHFGPGFTFTTFGNGMGPHMRAAVRRGHQPGQRQRGDDGQPEESESRLRIGGGNLLLILFVLWIMGVPLTYLWLCLMLANFFGVI